MNDKRKNVVLGITGGIAAYKAIDLASTLTKMGLSVHVVLTEYARKFVTPLTLEVITHNQVWTDDNCLEKSSIPHIKLADIADLIVVAPATANTVAKGANGLADNLLSSILLAAQCPVLYVPAMNSKMYEHEATQRNLSDLRAAGATVMEPEEGMLACGVLGKGRYPANRKIAAYIESMLFGDEALKGMRVLVTAGGTREAIDPVRFIGNRSSGKMGAAFCEELARRGADTTLILGSHELLYEPKARIIRAETAKEMYEQVMNELERHDIVIMTAAVADFIPASPSAQKIKKEETNETQTKIDLTRSEDILRAIGNKAGRRIVVGFAAETQELEENAKKKLKAKNLDMIVANDVSREDSGFGSEHNKALIFLRDGSKRDLPWMPKTELAARIVDEIIRLDKFARLAR